MELKEFKRKSIHMLSLFIPFGYRYLLGYNKKLTVLILFFLTILCIIIELVRLENGSFRKFFNKFFGNMMRNHESVEFSGATYLMISAIFTIAIFPRDIAFVALSFLAIGDTMAALVGIHFGKRKMFSSKKSVEGTLACLISTFAFALIFKIHPVIAFVGAVAATMAEFSKIPLDDNFKIPIFSGLIMSLTGLFIW